MCTPLGHAVATPVMLLQCNMQIYAPKCCWVIVQLSLRQSQRLRAVAEHTSHYMKQQCGKPT